MEKNVTSDTTTQNSESLYPFSKTLEKIEAAYTPGAIEFFEKNLKPNTWQMAHDFLEQALLSQDQTQIKLACQNLETTCLGLLEKYKKHMAMFHNKPEWSNVVEQGFYSGNTKEN